MRTGLEGPGLTCVQKLMYALMTIGGRYGWTRVNLMSFFGAWGGDGRVSGLPTGEVVLRIML